MKFNVLDFFKDYHVANLQSGHKHCRPGWVQTPCPFCTGNPGYHLGYNLAGGFFTCWRCGFHTVLEVVQYFARVNWDKAKGLIGEYSDGTGVVGSYPTTKHDRPNLVKLPPTTGELTNAQAQYLKGRGFSPQLLCDLWGLKGAGPLGPYKHRIIAPITFNEKMVSYQGRDFTGRSSLRYKACPQRTR